jgi:predicted  nucleic acid-binding Zn-ribbon protein
MTLPVEERVSRLEGAIEQINERFGNLERGQDTLKAELRAEMAQLRAELRAEMVQLSPELRAELRAEMSELRAELRADMRANFRMTMWVTLALFTPVMVTAVGALFKLVFIA